MKKIYFTVGPSQVYPTLYKHLQNAIKADIPSLNHRGAEFKALYKSVDQNLKKLLGVPQNYQIFFVSCALEGMERTILGGVDKTSFHIVTGSFGKSWAKYAEELGKKVIKVETKPGEGIELQNLSISKEAELIAITQNDTSTGIQIPMEDIYALKQKYPEKLITIDVVSSIPFLDIEYKYIDITFFSVQKGFGVPAGLGIMIVSPDALKKAKRVKGKGKSIGSYHSLLNFSEKYQDYQTPETPNVLNIYLLDNVVKDMLKRGIGEVRQETLKKAQMLYKFFENHKKYNPFVKNVSFRSLTTPVMDVKGDTEKIRAKLAKHGYIIGTGYGDFKNEHIRIGNFPAHTQKDLKKLLTLV